MTNTKVIYIQDDRTSGTTVQFCYSEDMQMIDNWMDAVYGEDRGEVFHGHWEQNHPTKAKGVRNLQTAKLNIEEFIGMCNTLEYTVIRVRNKLHWGDEFKNSCLRLEESKD